MKKMKLPGWLKKHLDKASQPKSNSNPTAKKVNRKLMWMRILSVFIVLAFAGVLSVLIYFGVIISGSPKLQSSDFVTSDSTKIYDRNGELISDVGYQIRENITYDDLPQTLIDAFVSIEDSRFFEHNGFDLPRFTIAIFRNLRTLSFSQGGSTFTMQLVKGTYFESEEATAARSGLDGVNRKIREIYLATKAEKVLSKKRILELYLNRINFGVPGNKRGIQTAAQYYFGKDVQELNLIESAMLAGVINAPNAYSPMKNLDKSQTRTSQVLDLMVRHGYITQTEAELAKATPIENLLVGNLNSSSNEYPYQAFVDATINEVIKLTGLDPVDTPMRIYTTMDRDLQTTIEEIQNGENYNVVWPNEYIQTAAVTLNNQTGEILALGGGRYYNGERLRNRAVDMTDRQPGSSVKTLFTYPLAFEYLGWSTQHMLEDKPIVYSGTDKIVKNFDNRYRGDVLIPEAIGSSLNIPAIETLQAVTQTIGRSKVMEYLHSIGFTNLETDKLDMGYAIGGSSFEASPLQLAAAHAAIVNGGVYVQPHTVTRIEFMDGREPITPSYSSTNVISNSAAYMATMMMEQNVSGPYSNFMQILRRDFQVYAKTGTSDWGTDGRIYNIPDGAAKDKWMLSSTSEFTTAVWMGYDKGTTEHISHVTTTVNNMNIPGRISNEILKTLYASRSKPADVARPRDVQSIRIVRGVYPYVQPNESTNPDLIVEALVKSEYATLGTLANPTVQSLGSFKVSVTPGTQPNQQSIKLEFANYPDAEALKVAENTKYFWLEVPGQSPVEATGQRLFDYSWIYGPIVYKARISVDGTVVETVKDGSATITRILSIGANSTLEVCGYYGYDYVEINSNEVCSTYKMSEHYIEVPALIGNTEAEFTAWLTSNQLSTALFPINKTEKITSASQISLLGKIYKVSPDRQHTIIPKDKIDTNGFTVYILQDETINFSGLKGSSVSSLPAYCTSFSTESFKLCAARNNETSGTVKDIYLGTGTTPLDVNTPLSFKAIYDGGGLRFTVEAATPSNP